MQKSIVQMIVVVMSVVGEAGCAEFSIRKFPDEKSIQYLSLLCPRHIQDLARAWEYEDKMGPSREF